MKGPILIVGGGLAGLCCALHLQDEGRSCLIFEAGDASGGRVRTDVVDGFLLDRGFQVFLPAYPEARAMLDLPALHLCRFDSGAAIRYHGRFHLLGDPVQSPALAWPTLVTDVVTFTDKLRTLRLRHHVLRPSLEGLMQRRQTTTADYLRQLGGFSSAMIGRFFQPWLRGIFLEPRLETSSRMFEFVYRMFALGGAALPAAGMQAIPRQLAARLRPGTLRLNTPAARVQAGRVQFADGQTMASPTIVVATDAPAAARLLGQRHVPIGCHARCIYFAAPTPPRRAPLLMLNGEGSDACPVNHAAVLSEIAQTYAPPGQALVSCALDPILDKPTHHYEPAVREQMGQWFGSEVVGQWRLLRCDDIAYALPRQSPADLDSPRPVHLAPGLYRCGDALETGSIEGAMVSGRRAAHAILTGP